MARKETLSTQEHSYTAVFEPAEEGGYTVHFPALVGCVTEGDTLEEARERAAEALELYLESLNADGLPLPADVRPVYERVRVQVRPA